jgi:pyruvate/2-oxoglutarate dehydrogenase complex dihydrolipoamide dehydrogenase (E3) component
MRTVQRVDLAIVGAGSAGMAAANIACSLALQVCIIDERASLGGQDPHAAPVRELIARTQQLRGLRHFPTATAWGLFPAEDPEGRPTSHHVQFYDASGVQRVHARHVLLATGGYEAPVPFLGWHLPGVMSARGIATVLDAHGIAVSGRIVLAGTHPMLLTLGERLLAAGVHVQAIAFAQPLRELLGSCGVTAPRTLWTIAALRRRGLPVMFHQRLLAALGDPQVSSARLRNTTGVDTDVPCDALGVSFGRLAATELARQAGAQCAWSDEAGWAIQVDAFMRTSVPGISVAGNEFGIDRHDVAQLCGEIAATGIAVDARRLEAKLADERTKTRRKRLDHLRRATARACLRHRCEVPIALLDPATLICRCEDITVGRLHEVLRENPDISSANTVKSLTRVGMGLCQGRTCEINVRRLIAQLRNERLNTIHGFAVRAPIKPLPIGLLAAHTAPIDHTETFPS